ncbi:FecR family protein [Paracoccus aminovorans]|uniref:FecR family protein n=1 Tax=Paracoccus aminovorans TaxID=34004 RepID=UPI002B256CBE|nr:FecR family protein [Paracoccus aminovorans]
MAPRTEARLEEAVDWFLRLNDPSADDALQEAFREWLEQDPENPRAWENARRAWRTLGQAAPALEAAWPVAAAAPAAGSAPPPPVPRRRRAMPALLTAFAVAALVFLTGPHVMLWLRADYLTRTAETRTIELEDGSVVSLAAQTAVDIDMSGQKRRVRLLAGEAFFEVAPDPSRPFVVTAGDVRAKVLGTAFNVRMSSEATRIDLVRGSLRVAAGRKTTLSPGDSVTVSHDTGRMRRGHLPPDEIASWRDGRIFVEDAPITAVVEQIQRYHRGWIRLSGDTLGRQRVTGLYDLRDPDSALRALVQPYGGQVRQISPWLVILSGGPAS